MDIMESATGHEMILVQGAVASRLARLLNPEIPFVWILGHMPNRIVQWWETEVPWSTEARISAKVRMLSYDMLLRTEEFLGHVEALDDHGLALIQSRKPMPDTLDLSRVPETQQDAVVIGNGGFLRVYLPHAMETASVVCYEPGYLQSVIARGGLEPTH